MKEEILKLISQKYKIKKDNHEQLYAHELDNLKAMDKFLCACDLP